MPRKTSLPAALRVVSEREVDEDPRLVSEAFPAAVAPESMLGNDILELLKKSHDRIAGEVHQATAVATEAIQRADAATARVGEIVDQSASLKADVQATGATILRQINDAADKAATAKQATAAAVAISAGALRVLGERLAALATFAIDRAPALLALGAGVWLWHGAMADPKPMQLVGLGLFGAVVIAPAIWLSSRRG